MKTTPGAAASPSAVITSGFWRERLDMNANDAIFYQWEQLETSGCLDNFRIAAGLKTGFREGFFFADSDAYKWLDAAARILAVQPSERLEKLVEQLIDLLEAVQTPDGYIFTHNQVNFPGQRWVNLQIEHELYCLGHLIEAGVAHHLATGSHRLLTLVRRSADLLVNDMLDAGPEFVDGHEEIELALIKLYRLTGEDNYLELARRFLERRGRIPFFPLYIYRQSKSRDRRDALIRERRAAYVREHPEYASFRLPPDNPSIRPPFAAQRRMLDQLFGKYFQQHRPIRRQGAPVGHAVRFTYLQTAAAMLARETGDSSLRASMEAVWERMVTRRMYVTGGLGSLPFTEGFGNDYELHPEYAYAETCAALGSLFWNDELARLTGDPRYSDLFEWQLYNAASVGIGQDGHSYFYNNPLTCRGSIARQGWFLVPCCPSNLSRTWAWLAQYVYHRAGNEIRLHQWISSEFHDGALGLRLDCGLPYTGSAQIRVLSAEDEALTLNLRIPAWSGVASFRLNGQAVQPDAVRQAAPISRPASGYDPSAASQALFTRRWQAGDCLEVDFPMPIRLLRQDGRIPQCGGMAAVARGPLVYCLESTDHPGLDIFNVTLQADSLTPGGEPCGARLSARTPEGAELKLIPYMLWGNRGPSSMTIFMKTA